MLHEAARAGAVVIVDVTRCGKILPDSFAKTVPIWCAVVNAVAALTPDVCSCEVGNDICLHCKPVRLHRSVCESEVSVVDRLLSDWVTAWRNAGLTSLLAAFQGMKPLRCLWVSEERPGGWRDGLPLSELNFTPVVCLTAGRMVAKGERSFVEARGEGIIGGVAFPKRGGFAYVRGAGDDEEGWAQGLLASVFWERREGLLAGDGGEMHVQGKVKEIVEGRVEEIEDGERGMKGITKVWECGISVTRAGGSKGVVEVVRRVGKQFSCVIVLGAGKSLMEVDEEMEKRLLCMPLLDDRGKIDFKYGFGRALGPCLAKLSSCCEWQHNNVLICCTSKNGDWTAGLVIAWLSWHCIPLFPQHDETYALGSIKTSGYRLSATLDDADAHMPRVSKATIHATMLHFSAAFPSFQLSRPTLKQLNRFFSSPSPSSSLQ